MSEADFERIEAIDKPVGFLGSRTFREVQTTMRSIPKQRQRVFYGMAVILSGAEHLIRAITDGTEVDSAKEAKRGAKEIVIGGERIVDALFTGVATRMERGINEVFGPLRDEMREVRELRARQIEDKTHNNFPIL